MKIDLGSGAVRIDGYTPIDWSLGNDVCELPFADNSLDEIRASHVLEHVERSRVVEVTRHWVDKLRPGGILRIAVPDFDEIMRLGEQDATENDPTKSFDWEGYIMGGQIDDFDHHHTIWNRPKLEKLFATLGLVECKPWKNSVPIDCSDLPVSLNLAARKPMAPEIVIVPPKYTDMRACMTMPRLTWTDNMLCVLGVCKKLDIDLTKTSGVFYGQCMQRALNEIIQIPDLKWILTIDYDSIMEWQDVVRLREIAERNNLDAIAPLQCGRERQSPLLVACDENYAQARLTQRDLDAEFIRVSSMHFGCTLLSVEKLKTLPKPWFASTPDKDGEWGDLKIDDDVHFWKQCQGQKWKLGVAPSVSIGHIETIVSWASHKLTPLYQPLFTYLRSGKPWYVRARETWRHTPDPTPDPRNLNEGA